MWSLVRVVRGAGLLVFVFALFQGMGTASAATGTVLADLTPPGLAGGVSVAFDGQYLWYTDLSGAVLHRVTPTGTSAPDVPILGGVGINALTYDASHDVFWGVDNTGLNVYRIEKDGWTALEFSIIPALDLPGQCNSLTGCSPTVSGLAYDATDDSLWYVPQGSTRVYHFNTAGQLLGFFDTNDVPGCASNSVTGIAAGASALYVTAGSCTTAFQYAKSDSGTATNLSSFSVGGLQSAGASCDDVSFPNATVLWVRDAATGHVRAVQIPSGTCIAGGGVSFAGSGSWMAGAGQGTGIETLLPNCTIDVQCAINAVQHAFHLLCNQTNAGAPNNMVINWQDAMGNHFGFHLKHVVTTTCDFTPTGGSTADGTIQGTATGTFIGRGPGGEIVAGGKQCIVNAVTTTECGQVDFSFTDQGEGPTSTDHGEFTVTDLTVGTGILEVCACVRSNYQAHEQ